MAFDEVKKAIAWSSQTKSQHSFPVHAYLSIHIGTPDAWVDKVTYAHGSVWAVDMPTPHLFGHLDSEWLGANNGDMVKVGPQPGNLPHERRIDVEIFPDGKLTYQLFMGGKPIGGMSPYTVQGASVNDVLITAVLGNDVITMGVELKPEFNIIP
jgi:hypothetical protein